jgi:hypothetical protein
MYNERNDCANQDRAADSAGYTTCYGCCFGVEDDEGVVLGTVEPEAVLEVDEVEVVVVV